MGVAQTQAELKPNSRCFVKIFHMEIWTTWNQSKTRADQIYQRSTKGTYPRTCEKVNKEGAWEHEQQLDIQLRVHSDYQI